MRRAFDPPRRAAQYLRMSTDHQRYSIEAQTAAIAAYALASGYEIHRTYADPGISGLRFETRPALQQLLTDVLSGDRAFEAVLVYDVSRWGRFQDPDESAHYEFLCRQAGVQVVYCAEPFVNDGSFAAILVKHIKRGMAAEYSRELSAKVIRAKHGLAAKGYWVGGSPGYGMRRRIVMPDGAPGQLLQDGDRKALQGHRVILTPGPAAEVETVRRIFRLYVVGGYSMVGLVALLNAEGTPALHGGLWTKSRVKSVLRSEKYCGVYTYGMTHQDLQGRRRGTRRLRLAGAWRPVISRAMFDAAQTSCRQRKPWMEDAALLDELRTAWADQGALSAKIIAAHPATHAPSVYKARFGGLLGAYQLIGYAPTPHQVRSAEAARRDRPFTRRPPRPTRSNAELTAGLQALLDRTGRITVDAIDEDPALPSAAMLSQRFGGMAGVYAAVGYTPTRRQALLARPRPSAGPRQG
ncbi:recombinase family protein [Phenylobacterium deserti]|uniref:Recombinase family protein n=1 Tax=Phenylobacterium deserti TaxID=1914756 RepID=A0A328AIU9_9CAUL|nr:recombinase family protein [Phenylobacterium deserti]RAK52778.1 recombinase family protein [Phenylobacterium deserti]